ncbi:MAG TPA: LolA-related protein [Steroidobacteraceae bacterium]|nr:LolA-related protein [Steroidobacteraceae bacterium]
MRSPRGGDPPRWIRRHRALGLLALLIGLPARSDDLDTLMQRLARHRHGEASFVEQHFMRLLKRPVESMGELRFDAPDRLEKRTLEPQPEDLVLEGEELRVTRHGRTRTASLADYPRIRPLIESIRATLAGDRAALEQVFEVHFFGDLERWSLLLVPRDADSRVTQVQIEGARDELLMVEVRERSGDRSLLTLREHPAP